MKKKLIILILFILSPLVFTSCDKNIYYTHLLESETNIVDYKNPLYLDTQITLYRKNVERFTDDSYDILKEFNKVPLYLLEEESKKNEVEKYLDYSIYLTAYYKYEDSQNESYDISYKFNLLHDGTLLFYKDSNTIYYSNPSELDYYFFKDKIESKTKKDDDLYLKDIINQYVSSFGTEYIDPESSYGYESFESSHMRYYDDFESKYIEDVFDNIPLKLVDSTEPIDKGITFVVIYDYESLNIDFNQGYGGAITTHFKVYDDNSISFLVYDDIPNYKYYVSEGGYVNYELLLQNVKEKNEE